MAKLTVEMPDEAYERLNVQNQTELEAVVEGGKIIFATQNEAEKHDQRLTLRYAMAAGVLGFIIALMNFLIQKEVTVPMTGGDSLTQVTIYIGMTLGMIGFIWMSVRLKLQKRLAVGWPNLFTLTLAYGVIGFVGLALFLRVSSSAFAGARLDIYTTSAVIGTLVAGMAYIMVGAAQNLRFQMIISVLIATLVGGVVMSMVTNGRVGWWQHNFSYLGTDKVGNGWLFNFSLIFSALIMLALLDYLFTWLDAGPRNHPRLFTLRILFSLSSLTLGAVGVFPNNPGWLHQVHDFIAQLLVLWILVMIVAVKWLVPHMSAEFLITSYGIAGALVVSEFLFQKFHYLSLTAFELIAFGLAFTWMILLLQNLRRLATESTQTFMVKIDK
jgi:hypothetical membrane protein